MKIRQIPRLIYSKSHDWKHIVNSQTPLVIEGLAKDWPALANDERRWSNLELLNNRISADRFVRVEVGKSYMDPNVVVSEVSMREYLSLLKSSEDHTKSPFYLAQYELKNIPEMYEDVIIPEFCSTAKGDLYHVNLWFGSPLGNVSPCHYDPFNNILVQVIGKKIVEIIHPSYSKYLYPALGTIQKNTSRVDFENPNLQKFPLFSEVERHVTELQPGDGVFIPYKWWHYCKSSELSCSVNFWWL